ncbi:MAG: hypothetical protein ACTSWY_09690 [Promethearchaeota archaeon]
MEIRDFFKKIKPYVLGRSKHQKESTKIFFGKKFGFILSLFLIYNLILINTMYIPEVVVNFITFGNPYTMGVALVFSFIIFALLFCNTRLKEFLFGKKTWLKQLLIIPLIIIGNFYLWRYLISIGLNFLPILLIIGIFWLVYQGLRLFIGARSFSTKVESKMLKKYSTIRYFFVLFVPIVILVGLTVLTWTYRYYLIILTLDLFGMLNAEGSIGVYRLEMNIILPFLYISLIIIFILLFSEFILTRKKANRRSGSFDNFAFALIVFFMYIYLLWNISLYLFLNESTVDAVSSIAGGATSTGFLFLAEFAISMLFLYRAIRKTGKAFGWNVLFLNQDALILIFLASILAQTSSRIGVFTEIMGQDPGILTNIISMDHILIPILLLIFLGITIIIYYLRPQETSIFMRIAKQTVDNEDKSMEIILKFLRSEFIRRGKEFPIDEIEKQLLSITDLQKAQIYSLIHRLDEKYMDVQLIEKKTEQGTRKFIDFLSITERYESDKKAEGRARHYMTGRLSETLTQKKKQKRIAAASNKKISGKAQSFISTLGKEFAKKVKEEEKTKSLKFGKELLSSVDDVLKDQDTVDIIYTLIKNEYLYRAKNISKFEECRIEISEIAEQVQKLTRITPGVLYPLLAKITENDWNLDLLDLDDDIGTKEDQYIDFITPIDEFEISNVLQNYRPEKLLRLRILLWSRIIESTTTERKKIVNNIQLSKKIKNLDDYNVYAHDNFGLDIFYSKLLNYFDKFHSDLRKFPKWSKDYEQIKSLIKLIEGSHIKSLEIIEKRKLEKKTKKKKKKKN